MRIFSSKMLLNSGMFVVEFPCGPQKSSKSQSILEDVDFFENGENTKSFSNKNGYLRKRP